MLSNNIGIDLGSSNIRIYIEKEKKIISTKSLIAIDNSSKEIISCGIDAVKYIDKTPEGISLKKPIEKGVITDLELTIEMIRNILKDEKIKRRITNPNIVVAYDRKLNNLEKEVLEEVFKEVGAKNVYLIDSMILSSIGLSIDQKKATMIIDIGYETTKIGILLMDGIVYYDSIICGGNTLNEEIISYIREKYKVLIGSQTVEKIKKELQDEKIEVNGRDLITGLIKKVMIERKDIDICLDKLIEILINKIKEVIERISPEILNDISEKGIIITGGGSKTKGLREKLEKKINIPVLIPKNPENCIIEGIKELLENNKYNIYSLTK